MSVKLTYNNSTIYHPEAAQAGDIWKGRHPVNNHCYVAVIEPEVARYVTYLRLSNNGMRFTEDAVKFYYSFEKVV